ncbi:sialin-like [Liolophura sinensis]|uniref:sialin-like n=1 Tax=Liolophura sinensis TaxID=3198878 RepID=UPI0031582E2C
MIAMKTVNPPQSAVSKDLEEEKCECCTSRHTFALLCSIGLGIAYFLRFNLSVAMVAMVTGSSIPVGSANMSSHSKECPRPNVSSDNTTIPNTGEFEWNPKTQGLILSSFFYGYCVMQIPGGWVSTRYGAKLIVGLSILIQSLLALLTPVAARTHIGLMIAVRAVEGLAGGALFPSVHTMVGRWAPVNERSKIIAYIGLGPYLGVVSAFFGAGWLCDQPFLGGWPSAFYIPGCVGCVWFLFWMFIVHSSPSKHPRISKRELHMITSSIGENIYEKKPVPWVAMLTCAPFWAVCVAFTCSAWGSYTLMTELPSFMKAVIGVNVSQSGLLSALPYAVSIVFTLMWANLADFLRKKEYLSVTKIRKLMNTIAALCPAAFLVLSSFVGCNQYVVAGMITGATCFQVADAAGSNAVMIDMAPHLAGLIKSVCNTFATLTGIVSPYLAGVLVNDGETKEEWSKVFYIAAGVLVFDAVFFLIFASGDVQPWSAPVTEIEVTTDEYSEASSQKQLWSGSTTIQG